MTTPETMQETRRLIGRAVSLPPVAFYEALGQPQLADLKDRATEHFFADGARPLVDSTNDIAKVYFVTGLAQAAEFVGSLAAMHPELDEGAFSRIAEHERTIESLAYMASQNERQAVMVHRNPGLVNQLSDDHTHITLTEYGRIRDESPVGPCPAVRYDPETDRVAPEPIFVRFGAWAGKIGVQAYFAYAR